ncbi:ABC transporter permease [Sodalis sp. RH22]|uniref:ABC transporter permease n=1 Tax=unclassified Sodalis (in: enterobacteria) TaxID=2636512 RepID=UPI0039B421EA
MTHLTFNLGQTKKANFVKNIMENREVSLFIIVMITFILFSISLNNFFSFDNIRSIFAGSTFALLLASGLALVIITAGIDLSVGAMLSLTSVFTCTLLSSGIPTLVAVPAGLFFSVILGGINGLGVAWLKIPSFIVTLAMFSVARGVATVWTSGYQITNLPTSFLEIGSASVLNIPLYILIIILFIAFIDLLLRYWKPLHIIYYIGLNEEASRLSGMKVARTLIAVYAFSGLFSGIAAILISAKSGMGYAGYGLGSELNAITAAVIGGANLNGGRGSVFGACLGVIFLAMVNNGFILAGINPNWQWFINGVILILFLVINAATAKKQ